MLSGPRVPDQSARTDERPRLLFVSLVNDVGSDRIIAEMGRYGAHCAVMSAPDAFAAQTRHAERVFALPQRGGSWTRSLLFGARLAYAAQVWRPDLVIPLDEFSARSLRDPKLYQRAGAEVRALLAASLGAPDAFATLCNRHRLVETAAALGIATPTQVGIEDLETAHRTAVQLGYPVVLKREQTCGGAGVAIVHNEAELVDAFRRSASKAAAKRRLQRLLARDVAEDSPLVLQRHVSGPLAFRALACKDGRVLEGQSFLSECVHPPVTGASTVLRPIERPDMDAASATLIAALGCSGFVSLDFLLPADGPAVFIEMNPRPVASGHLGRLLGHDLYAAMLGTLAGAECDLRGTEAAAPERIVLFPRELDRDPFSQLAASGGAALHDVPWDDAASLAAHARWLAQRHPDRAVHLSSLLGIDLRSTTAEVVSGAPRPRAFVDALESFLAKYLDLRGPASVK